MMTDVPMLKGRKLDERITIPVERELKRELNEIKTKHGVDVLEWLRMIARRELPQLKKRLTA